MSAQPWNERWELVKENLGSGGQGKTSLVRSRLDGTVAVMKRLKQQQDPERRKRMHREAEALRTLSHPGVPKLIDSNTSEFDGTVPLFIVVDYIEGPTLETFVEEHGRLDLADAVTLTVRLLEIVEHSHESLFGHRDIKPDNVMLRGASKFDPVLIDFGLSFNFEPEESTLVTRTEQQIGNRFLALPELTTPGSTKRDARSDFASCVGILYYLLSGYQPMTLRDADGKAPHERRDFVRVLENLPDRVRTLITLLFGRGFMYRCDDRYQDASTLKRDLEALLKAPTWSAQGSERVQAAIERAQLRSNEASALRETNADSLGDALSAFLGPIRDALSAAVKKRAAIGIPIREVPVSYTGWKSLAHRILDGKREHCFQYQCKATGTRGFDVYLQVEPSTGEGDALALFTLYVNAPGHPWIGARYLLKPRGHWERVQHGPVEAIDLIETALSWFDSEELWERPEIGHEQTLVANESVSDEGIAAAARHAEYERVSAASERLVESPSRPLEHELLQLLKEKGGGGYNFLKLALELGVKPSEVRPLIEVLYNAGEISLLTLTDDEVVYRLAAPVERAPDPRDALVTGFTPGPVADCARAIIATLASAGAKHRGYGKMLNIEKFASESGHPLQLVKDAATLLAEAGLVEQQRRNKYVELTRLGREEAHRLGEAVPSPREDAATLLRFLQAQGDGTGELDNHVLCPQLGFHYQQLLDAGEVLQAERMVDISRRTTANGSRAVFKLEARGRAVAQRNDGDAR